SFDIERPELLEREEALGVLRGCGCHIDLTGLGERLHSLREPDRVSLRRVVHTQIVADLADHHLARVNAYARRDVEPALLPQLLREAPELVAQMERRVARTLGMIFVRDRRAEQRHDAVARVLVHRALEAMDAVGENRKEAIQGLVPLLS